MLELLSYDFMQRSLLAAAMVGGLCSVIGVFVVLRGLAFVGAGTAHAAFAGVALAYLIGWPPLLLAILFGLVTVWITGWVEEKGTMKLDVSIGILYTTTMALAILFIGLMKTYNAEVYGYLFGNVLAVTVEELRTISALSIVVLGHHSVVLEGIVFHLVRSGNGRGVRRAGQDDVFLAADSGCPHGGRVPQNRRCDFSVCHDTDPCFDRLPVDT